MTVLESLEEDDPKRILFYKPIGWLGQIRYHRRDEAWSASLWQTFFATDMGADKDRSLNKSAADKILKDHADYNNCK